MSLRYSLKALSLGIESLDPRYKVNTKLQQPNTNPSPADGDSLFPFVALAAGRAREDTLAAAEEEARVLFDLAHGVWTSPLCPGCSRMVERTERHHVPGRHEGLTAPLCYVCHREVSELSRAWSPTVEQPEARALLGLSDLFAVRSKTFPVAAGFALRLRSQAEALQGGGP